MSFISPQGYTPGLLASQIDVSSPLLSFDPPLVSQSYNASSGAPPPTAAWNVTVFDGSWSGWNDTTTHSAQRTSVFTSTPGSQITYSFLGIDYYVSGNFSGQSSSVSNGTLELIIDGHTITSASYGTNGNSGVNASIEGFGLNYGSQLPGSFGYIGGLDYDWHEVTIKLNQGWLQVDSLVPNLYLGASG